MLDDSFQISSSRLTGVDMIYRIANNILQGSSKTDNNASSKNKKDEPAVELTPLERVLQNAGPLRGDGSDKYFGLENVGLHSGTLLCGRCC